MESLQGFLKKKKKKSPCGQRANTRKPQPQRSFFSKFWALEYRWEGKQSVGLPRSSEEKTAPRGLTEPDGQTQGGGEGAAGTCAPRSEPWAAPPWPSGRPRLLPPPHVLWPTPHFPHLHLLRAFLNTEVVRGLAPRLKAAQLQFPPKLSGCSRGFRVTAAVI